MAVVLYYPELNWTRECLERLNKSFNTNVHALDDVDAIIAPLRKIDLSDFPNLKVVASNTTGDDHIDLGYCKKNGIEVITLKGDPILKNITAVAELTIGLIIALTRNIIPAANSVLEGKWSRWEFGGKKMLKELKLGVIGNGRIGGHVLERVAIFFDTGACDVVQHLSIGPLEHILNRSDVVTVHIPKEGNDYK